MGTIRAVCISREKGTAKEDIGQCRILENYGLENDAHAGSKRQVSLLSYESVQKFEKEINRDKGQAAKTILPAGAFGENLLIEGCDVKELPVGTRLYSGNVVLEITQIGKECHGGCTVTELTGRCIMPKEGVFAKVLQGGVIKAGDEICTKENQKRKMCPQPGGMPIDGSGIRAKNYAKTAVVLTSSDRASRGEYEDISGKTLKGLLEEKGYEVLEYRVLPDDEETLYEGLVSAADKRQPDVIFTTGGTGPGPRDRMPEATIRACDRRADGISEAIRSHSMQYTPNAMLSRAASGIRNRTLIINLPGAPKAVEQCLEFLLPVLEHGLRMLRGEHDG